MGPPGFEPESQAPKAQRIDQATLRTHIHRYVDNILIIISITKYINVTIISIIYKKMIDDNIKIKPRTGIEPATTRLQVSRSTRLSHRGNIVNIIEHIYLCKYVI